VTEHPDESTRLATRQGLHAVAEHVLGAALWQRKRRIGLRQVTGGFTTQCYPERRGLRRVAVVGTDLVVEDDDLAGTATVRREPITTMRAAGELVGAEVGMRAEVYEPGPLPDLDEPLDLDAATARRIADGFASAQSTLTVFCAELVADDPAAIQLWPEHFDLATTVNEVNYGFSPGDEAHPEPYLYVGPWSPPPPDAFWNEAFGASRPLDAHAAVEEALAFFHEGRARAAM
jgi:hypothetical protein